MQQKDIVYFLNASSNKTCSTVWCTSCTWTIFEYSVRPAGLCEAPQLCGEFVLTLWRKSSVATKRKNALLSLAAGPRRRSAQALRPFAHRNGGAPHTCKEGLCMGSADPVRLKRNTNNAVPAAGSRNCNKEASFTSEDQQQQNIFQRMTHMPHMNNAGISS